MLTSWIAHYFFVITGARNESGWVYGFWSGFGGSIPDVLILTAIAGFLWHRNCHIHRCWRIGRHHVEGTPYVTCRRHHPSMPARVTADDVADAHRRRM
jgi:hypothetical protein